MMTVNLPAKTLDEGIKNMMNTAKMDYEMWSTHTDKGKISDYTKEVLDKWDTNVKVLSGKKFIKIVRENSVFAFVCKDDISAPFTSFKKGDILKAASWKRPAYNQARGNVLKGNYPIEWTGPLYLK